ncbi:hypothetical protein HOY80DRAFT_893562 [Tuber brumale]|nr:hypothetical protein HOY80DRAFT_893562 [Tuber brumale]
MNIRKELIALALATIANGASKRKAAIQWGVSCTTLQSCWNSGLTASSSHQYQQCLSPEQECHLCDWIIEQEVCGYTSSHSQV